MPTAAPLENSLQDVHGWLTMEEAYLLHDAVASSKVSDPIVVEIGAWKGRSTIALGLAAKRRLDRARVYSIDPHLVADEPGRAEYLDEFGSIDTFAEFSSNVERAGIADWVSPMRALSFEARSQFDRDHIDVLFVDGSHEYDDVVRDIDDWVHLVPSGGFVAFNDPSRDGVNRALIAKIVSGSPYTKARLCRNTLAFTIDRSRTRTFSRVAETVGIRLFLRALRLATKVRCMLPRPLLQLVRASLTALLRLTTGRAPLRAAAVPPFGDEPAHSTIS